MSFGIERQSDQYGSFTDDVGVYASRDRAVYDIPDGVHQYLASAAPSIATGLNNTRQAFNGMERDPAGDPRDLYHDAPHHDGEPDPYTEQFDHEMPEDYDQFSSDPGPHPDFHGDAPHPFGTPVYNPKSQAPPGHFSQARRRTADDAGSDFQAFNTDLYTPGDKLDPKSQMLGGDPERWPTAAAVGPAQPAAPADPVWLGHTYAPAHRVGMPWRGQTLPGTVTHLEGTNIGVRWDDGQHSTEEASAIHPLY